MPTARDGLGDGVTANKLYAVGGDSDANGYAGWTVRGRPNGIMKLKPMPTAREGLAAAVVAGDLYAIGGLDPGDLTTVEAYAP